MNNNVSRMTLMAGVLCAALAGSATVMAQEPQPVPSLIAVQESATLVTFAGGTAKSGGFLKIRVAGPDGYTVFESSSKSGLIDWVLESDLPDGYYNYDVWFTPAAFGAFEERTQRHDYQLQLKTYEGPRPAYHSGVFVIEGGALAPPVGTDVGTPQPGPNPKLSWLELISGGLLDLVIPTAAAGTCTSPCVIADSNGQATVHLNDNDTGSTIDWKIFGGNSSFYLFSADPGTIPFSIDAEAPTNSLFIDDQGYVGLSRPSGFGPLESALHISNDFPSLRFDDTSSGDNTEWAIDIDFGQVKFADKASSTVPFEISDGAPTSSLFIEASGDVGIGTSTPESPLHVADIFPTITLEDSNDTQKWLISAAGDLVFGSNQVFGGTQFTIGNNAPVNSLKIEDSGNVVLGAGNFAASAGAALHVVRSTGAQLRVENTGAGDGTNDIMFRLTNASADIIRFVMKNATSSWTFDNAGNLFRIALVGGSTTPEFTVDSNGDGHFRGDVFANGIKLTSSQALKTGFAPVDEATLLAKVAALDISQWRYKSEPETAQHIGPMAEQFQAVFGLGDGKHLEMVDTTGIAFAAIQALEAENDAKDVQIEALQARNSELEARLVAQDARLSAIEAQMMARRQ